MTDTAIDTETRLETDPTRAAAADIPVLRFLLRLMGLRRSTALLGVAAAMSLLDLVGIAILFPYLDAVVRPGAGVNLALAAWFPQFEPQSRLLLLSGSMIILYALKSCVQTMLMRYQFKQMSFLTGDLTNDMVSRVLSARYATFQKTAASDLAGIAYSNTVHATVAFQALIQALNEILFLGFLLVAFLLVEPLLALALIVLLAVLYSALYFSIVRRTRILGNMQRRVESRRYRLLFSMISAIRDIKIMGLEPLFDARNREVSSTYADLAWRHNINGAIPRLFVEVVVLTGLVTFVAAYVALDISIAAIAPMLGVAVIAAIRAVPTFARLTSAVNTYRFSTPAVERLIAVRDALVMEVSVRHKDALRFAEAIELQGVGFRYGSTQTLRGVDLVVRRGQSIGIVGPSGSGKSTLLDLFTGLQPATEGRFLCDGLPFDPFTSQSMQKLVGYVPQTIALLDESISFNISFEHHPDSRRLARALRIANLEEFITSLRDGVETTVGENGLRLSGGQRQRVGIARAVYREPSILVFDEATSSLDGISERELSAEIAQLHKGITKIIVAHRLSTITDCDTIYVLSGGTVVDSGPHEDLLARCDLYRHLNGEQRSPQVVSL